MQHSRSLLVVAVAVAATLSLGACSDGTSQAVTTAAATASAAGATSAPSSGHGVIAVIGDSITGGHGLSPEQAWPSILARQEHWPLTNLSCDGAGVVAVGDADDCDAAYRSLVLRAVDLHPAVVVLQASSNDLGEGDATVTRETDQLVARVHREMPTARVVGLSAIWNQQAPPAQLAEISAAMQRAIRRNGGTFVDIGEPLRGHASWMQSDDVHPTERGQQAIAADVLRALQRSGVTV